jgi:hypothetical protein
MADRSLEEYFKIGADLNRALGDDYDFKAYLEAIKKRNPNEELNLQEIKNAYKRLRDIEKKAKGGMVTKKKVAGRLAMRGYGKAMKGKK